MYKLHQPVRHILACRTRAGCAVAHQSPRSKSQTVSPIFINLLRILELAVKYGKVYIITNAAEGWVEFSCRKFFPSCFPILTKIKIISARSRYERTFPGDVPKWKIHAFLETQEHLVNGNMKNLIALGDSMMELEAAHQLSLRF